MISLSIIALLIHIAYAIYDIRKRLRNIKRMKELIKQVETLEEEADQMKLKVSDLLDENEKLDNLQ